MFLEREHEETIGPPNLTLRETEALLLIAQGLTHAQIAEKLNIDVATLEGHVTNLHKSLGMELGAGMSAKSVFKAVELGMLDLDQLVGEFRLSLGTKFTRRELEILELMTQVEGPAINEDIAGLLFVDIKTVEFHKTKIHKKFGTRNSIQAGLRYLVAKRDGLIN